MKKELIICALFASASLSSCMNGGKGERQATPALDSIGDTIANSHMEVPKESDMNKEEQTFIFAAATGGMMEVEAGNLALSKSKNQQVKDFAAMMVKDHSKAGEDLKALLSKIGQKAPDTLTTQQQTHLRELRTLNDLAFDKQYMTMMMADHGTTVKLFDDGTRLPNADLKAFAAKTIPVIRAHRVKAVEIGKTLNLKNVNTGDDLLGESPAAGHTQ